MPLKASCLHVRLENLRIWDEMLTVVDRAGTRSKKIKSLYMFKQRTSSSHRLKREEGGRLGNLASFVPSFFLLNKIWSGPHSFFYFIPTRSIEPLPIREVAIITWFELIKTTAIKMFKPLPKSVLIGKKRIGFNLEMAQFYFTGSTAKTRHFWQYLGHFGRTAYFHCL